MAGIAWQTQDDVAEIGRRITGTDEPTKQAFLKVRADLIRRLKGRAYSGGAKDAEQTAANDVLEFVANLEPDLAFQLPEAEVYTDKGGAAYGAARGLHHAFNQWMKESKYELEIRKAANDYCLGYAVRSRGIAPRPGYEDDGIDWPWSESVPVGRFGWDTRAESFQDAEYAYQVEKVYQHDLIKQALEDNAKPGNLGRWDLKAIERMGFTREPREKLSYYVVYLPKADPRPLLPKGEKHPERYVGVQLYLDATPGNEPGFQQIRTATPHYGPNPYTLIGMQRIPDESMAVSVLLLTMDQARQFNDIVAANNTSAQSYAQMIVCRQKKLADMMQAGKHNHVYYDTAFDKDSYAVLEKGGLTDQGIAQEERAKETYYRTVGLTDIERGAVESDVTATQTAVAAGASNKRRDGQINTFQLGIEEDMAGILALLYYTDTVAVDLPPEAAQEGKSTAPVFFGGEFDKQKILRYYQKHYPDVPLRPEDIEEGPDVPLADMQLRVRLGSMGRKSQQERLIDSQGFQGTVQAVGATLLQFPFIDARAYVRAVAKRTGYVELPDYFDYGLIEVSRAVATQMQTAPAQGEQQPGTLKTGPQALMLPAGRKSQQPKLLQPQGAAPAGMGSSPGGLRMGAA